MSGAIPPVTSQMPSRRVLGQYLPLYLTVICEYAGRDPLSEVF
jgi:hypothetical protein